MIVFTRKSLLKFIIILLFLCCAVFTFWFYSLVKGCSAKESNKFSMSEWKSTPQELRFKFVEDIKDNNLLKNKSYNQIVKLLGQPDSYTNTTINYIINEYTEENPCLFNAIQLMEISFDNTGHFIKISIRSD